MTDKIINTNIEILGKVYSLRCPEQELESLQQAARYLNEKMLEVQESGKAINLERIAIITALNITYQYLKLDQQKGSFMDKINQHISLLQAKLDATV
ncbi:MAG: cell division protein ZapA, partial [Gammaproteobacteria bacterium]|nr:cell division protein ZapA [Gammaproteobacteria bacterium]